VWGVVWVVVLVVVWGVVWVAVVYRHSSDHTLSPKSGYFEHK